MMSDFEGKKSDFTGKIGGRLREDGKEIVTAIIYLQWV
jgi:hypothetical protein